MLNNILINRKNLINNIINIKNKNKQSKICVMVKANAYGVGLKHVVKTIAEYVNFFGVSNVSEAKLVKKYTDKKVLIVGPLEQNRIDTNFSYTCSSIEDVKYLLKQNKKIKIHIKINTGMNRYGINTEAEFVKILKLINNSNLNFEGMFTHFATVDNYVVKQNRIFQKFIKIAHLFCFKPLIHADNSFVNEEFNHYYDMVRIGFNLYNRDEKGFKSVVQIKSKVVQVNNVKTGELVGYNRRFIATQNMKVAVVPVGYADGFDMKYIGINLNVSGHKCKVLNICMDCFMIDISNTNIKKGDEIYILNEFNSLKFYAKYSKSSEYEVMTKFSFLRGKREFVD